MKHSWPDKTEYPFASHFLRIDQHQLHYLDEGQGDPILFVHGTPSWSFDYRKLIRSLSSDYRCLAVDHIGFGLSDKPVSYDYRTANHSATLEQFVKTLGLKNLTLVVHDFGGPIALAFAIRNPHLVRRLVVLNSWLWSSSDDPDFIRLRRVLKSPLLPFLYRYLNFSARFILPRSFGKQKLTGKLLKQYTSPFPSKSQRNGPLAFARSLLNDQDWFESLWKTRESISGLPTLFVWGMKDPVIGQQFLEKFVTGFPNSTVHRLSDCGHFPQEEEPEQVLKSIREFLSRHPLET